MKTREKTYNNRKIRYTYIKAALFISAVSAFFLPAFCPFEHTGDNMFTMYVNGEQVGTVANEETAQSLLIQARKQIAADSEELVLMEVDSRLEGKEVIWGQVDEEGRVLDHIVTTLKKDHKETLQRSYMVRVGNYTVSLANTGEVERLLDSVLGKYDEEKRFHVQLTADCDSELNVLTTQVYSDEEQKEMEASTQQTEVFQRAGVGQDMAEAMAQTEPVTEKNFQDYDLGLISMDFADKVEVVEAYQPEAELTPIQDAVDAVCADQEVKTTYAVKSGDTLSEISLTTGVPLDKIIEMNDTLDNENSIIRAGEELVVTITEPGISVVRTEQKFYAEDYDEDIVYVPNDEWYTYQTKVLQQPSAGHREVVATVTYRNDREESTEILMENVELEAVAKIVERGTKIPPTYMKPLSGGRITSQFGPRKAPKRGASTYHKGVDYATPTGTAVMASAAGTVVKAGWGSGYGYVVYIQHSDGRQTRYGHLSKVLVSAGQTVSQGQKIALSGNTGVSTGPHLHFEMLIGGVQVNPLKYLSY